GGAHWELDQRGLVGAETFAHAGSTKRRVYTYDGRGVLTSATTGGDVASYSYTASGLPDTISDLVSTRAVHHVSDQLAVDGVTYVWDTAGRVVAKGDWTFTYGPNGQLTRAMRSGRQIDFSYDEGDQRLLKRVDGVPVRANVAGGVLT